MANAYGWIPDEHDPRDRQYSAPAPLLAHLPAAVDLEPDPATPPIWDQGQLGSCTAHGTLACFLFAAAKANTGDPMLSRLQLYYNTRAIEGTVGQDAGGQIRDAIKATTLGIAPESMWPYDIERFTVQPPAEVVQAAAANVDVDYRRVAQASRHLMACLAEGFPVDLGFQVYESFESPEVAQTGVVPMPGRGEAVVGGHCVAKWGYGLGSFWLSQFPTAVPDVMYAKIRNSWNTTFGRDGYCLMPLAYLTDEDLASDFWTIRSVT
ncbi:MAG TPA: C1 family peptidase [Mycobacterium sp.]|jgi:C1A family cysteine protease|uniref:C1 family peptidase n=1 Tax=Mycobacterium sp. TaxID=1785 RepID=UPI002F3F477B